MEGREGTLYFQIIHGRVARQINTGYRLFPSEWDGRMSEIILPVSGDARRSLLLALKERMEKDIRRLESIIAGLERSGGTYPAGRVVELFHNPPPEDSHNFMAFGKRLVEELERVGKKRTAERYTTVLNSFTRFRGRDGDIPLEDIGSTLMLEYEAWLKDKGICPNSTSYYMRNLRAVYNRAVDKELTIQRSPFKHVYTGIDKTVKRAVPLKVIRMIRDLDLRISPGMEYARDMFMLSFYTRGMSFVDIAYLKKADLKSGVLTYRRQKPDGVCPLNGRNPCRRYWTGMATMTAPTFFRSSKIRLRMPCGSTGAQRISSTGNSKNLGNGSGSACRSRCM